VQVVRRAEDGVARVADVAAHAVRRPGGRDELHRPLGAGRARVAKAAERGLHEVDRREHVHRHAKTLPGLAVVPEQLPRRPRPAGAPVAARDRHVQRVEGALGPERASGVGGDPAGDAGQHASRQRAALGEQQVDALLVERVERHVVRRAPAADVPVGLPARDGGVQLPVRGRQPLGERGRAARDGRVRGRRLGGLDVRLAVPLRGHAPRLLRVRAPGE
jgi:hypothetical protein